METLFKTMNIVFIIYLWIFKLSIRILVKLIVIQIQVIYGKLELKLEILENLRIMIYNISIRIFKKEIIMLLNYLYYYRQISLLINAI